MNSAAACQRDVTETLSALGASCQHLAVPLPVESLHVATAAPKQTIPWAQAPSQERQEVCRDLSSLVVDLTHHNVSAACKTNETSVPWRKHGFIHCTGAKGSRFRNRCEVVPCRNRSWMCGLGQRHPEHQCGLCLHGNNDLLSCTATRSFFGENTGI